MIYSSWNIEIGKKAFVELIEVSCICKLKKSDRIIAVQGPSHTFTCWGCCYLPEVKKQSSPGYFMISVCSIFLWENWDFLISLSLSLSLSLSFSLWAFLWDYNSATGWSEGSVTGQCLQNQTAALAVFETCHVMMRDSLSAEIARFSSEPFLEFSVAI